jgi:serine/threonine-protein kinase
MPPEEFQRASELFNELIDVPEGELGAALDFACGGDAALRAEVARLLEADRSTGGFLERGAMRDGALMLGASVPDSIAHYRILSKLGEGGMGEVWRARDGKLERDVAIKFLPEAFAADPDRLARFTREAQVLASLSHPNIAVIYGVEDRALVMELVDGPTLAERIAAGPMPWEEAAEIACQMASALEAAHERGVVHRDLKPANVKVMADGQVKVLDFGLAKPQGKAPISVDSTLVTSSPTKVLGSGSGTILGTAAYMSPEQAKGKSVDRRADIWAFGVVLFEMLTGRNPFQRETVAETLAAVLKEEADLDKVPEVARPILERCLREDPRRRWQSIGDARIAIEEARAGVPAPLITRERSRGRMGWIVASLMAVVAITAGIIAVRHIRESPPPRPVVRFRLDFPEGVTLPPTSAPAFAPDGNKVAVIARSGSESAVWLHSLDSLTSSPLPGTEGATSGPIFSPDSRSLAFMRRSSLWRLDLASGATQLLCELCGVPSEARAALERDGQPNAWSREGIILFTAGM